MSRSETIRSSLQSLLKQKKLPFLISNFDRTQLKNNVILKPLVKQFATNRYKIFLQNIRSFLGAEVVEINEILQFSNKLFRVIANDIIVLEENDKVREQSIINEKKLIQLDKELSTLKVQLVANTQQIRTFDEMLEFIGGVMAAYNKRLNQCKEIYQNMHKIEISTTLEIQTVYDPNVTEEYYEKYHSQLTNVLGRMKRTLESLVEEIKVATNVDLPLRCHNFLVNSRNLILELESFLIDKNCVFNRLLSYVITIHQKNLNELLEKGTDKVKLNSIVYEVIEKNFYMFKIFDTEMLKIQESFESSRKQIESQFKAKNYNQVNKLSKQYNKHTLIYSQTIKQIKQFISNIDQEYMKYLTRTQFNVKMKRTNDVKEKIKAFDKYISSLARLGENDSLLKEKEIDLRQDGERLSRNVSNYINKLDPFTEEIFKKVFCEIQEKFIKISSIQESLRSLNNDHSSELKTNYIEEKLQVFTNLQESYFRTEKALISMIEDYKQGYEEQSQKNISNADDTIAKCRYCLEKLDPSIEANIEQWKKSQINRQTRFLQLIMHAEGQIHKERESHQEKGLFEDGESLNKKKEALAELARMKINFEALMRCYDTLVYKPSLSGLISELSFESRQEVKKQIEQNKQSLEEIEAYYKQLKQNQKPEIKNELMSKVQQIVRERINVMQEVIATYSCIYEVYAKMKSKPEPEELRNKYVQIGNQKILDYLTLLYLSRKELMNRVKQINSNSRLHDKTKQFLEVRISDFISPLEIRTTMEELEKYILCLGRAMEFVPKTQQLINEMIRKINNPKDQLYRGRVMGVSEEMAELKRNIDMLDSLEDGPLGKMSFGNLKNEIKKVSEYFVLAEQIIKEKNVEKMGLEIELKDQKVRELRNKVVQTLGG